MAISRAVEGNRKDKTIWRELQRQLDAKGLKVKRGSIQDATFIEADPGRSGYKPRNLYAKTRRSKDGIWAKKGVELLFGLVISSILGLISITD